MPVYPTPPGSRFDLGFDGTEAIAKGDADAASAFVVVTPSLAASIGVAGVTPIQRGLTSSGGNMTQRLRLIFPEPRQILGLRWNGYSTYGSSYGLYARYSLDATAAAWDGTWVDLASSGGAGRTGGSAAIFRNVMALALNDVKGIELTVQNQRTGTYTAYWQDIHVYGVRQPTGDHLQFWHPTLDQPLPPGSFDFGDFLRGTARPGRPFRVKNTSATKTAVGVNLSYSDLDGAPLGGDAGQVSADNALWFPNLNIGDLAPGAVSPVRHFRISTGITRTPAFAAAGRLRATPTSWTG